MTELKTSLSEQLLGHLLSDDNLLFNVYSRIVDSIFENETDRLIYLTLCDYMLSGKKLNTVKIAYETKRPEVTLQRIQDLISNVDMNTTVEDIIELIYVVSKLHQLKRFRDDLEINLLENSSDPEKSIAFISNFLNNINDQETTKKMLSMSEHVDNVLHIVERNMTETGLTGVPTPLYEINKKTNGLQGGDLIIVAGETSQGKTSLALSICSEASKENFCHFISLEMTENQLTSRLMSLDTGYNANKILTSKLEKNDLAFLSSETFPTRGRKIYIDNTESDINRIISNIHRVKAVHNTKLVIIDYLQLTKNFSKSMNKEQQIADTTRRLKNLAIELEIPIILISQLSRDRDNPYPRLSRLRDSGQIEEAADIVMFVYRADFYGREEFSDGSPSKGRAEIIFAKGRNIGTGIYHVKFDENLTKFSNDDYRDSY